MCKIVQKCNISEERYDGAVVTKIQAGSEKVFSGKFNAEGNLISVNSDLYLYAVTD